MHESCAGDRQAPSPANDSNGEIGPDNGEYDVPEGGYDSSTDDAAAPDSPLDGISLIEILLMQYFCETQPSRREGDYLLALLKLPIFQLPADQLRMKTLKDFKAAMSALPGTSTIRA